MARQLVKAGTSVAANYRAACRAKSPRDMVSKLKTMEEEADETLFWLEMIVESELFPEKRIAQLHSDMEQALAMNVASILTLRKSANAKAVAANRRAKRFPQSATVNRQSSIA